MPSSDVASVFDGLGAGPGSTACRSQPLPPIRFGELAAALLLG
jgi:hypothetical protein